MLHTPNSIGGMRGVAGLFRKAGTVPILDPSQSVPDCFVRAMKTEFPWISVERVANAEELCGRFAGMVQLVLIGYDCLASVGDVADRIALKHPGSIIAAVYDENCGPMSAVLTSRFVHSVLPMDLRLDVWLSVVRLLLNGGEYFPRSLLWATAETSGMAMGTQQRAGSGKALTTRESQVMELLSHGCQNKHIAAKLGVSQNTVKIHLHNITTKLGASNRTAAAAIYLDRKRET